MPSTVAGLLSAAGLEYAGSVRWGTPAAASHPGVYLVTLDESPLNCDAVLARAPISKARVAEVLRVRPELRLDASRPTVAVVSDRLAGCWLPDEDVPLAVEFRRQSGDVILSRGYPVSRPFPES